MAYVEMKNISKSFPGVKALSNVFFSADEGEVVALLGENGAGKSTLMNVLGGIVTCDEGEIVIGGRQATIKSVRDSQSEGIAFIHQELSLFPQLTVEENLFIDGFIKKSKSPFLDKRRMRKKASEVISMFGMDIDPHEKVRKLAMGEQQLVEIASAVLKNSKILILDEPTTSLTERECNKLFEIINRLRAEKKIIILITHDLDRALAASDRVYVLRDGQNAGDGFSKELTREDIVQMMIGERAGKRFFKTAKRISNEKVLEFNNLSTDCVKNVTFSLNKGEVLGMYGLIGSGRTELIHALFGLDKVHSGEIIYKGKSISKLNPGMLIKKGISYFTENRRDEGLFLEHGVNKNITITDLKKISGKPFGTIDKKKDAQITREAIKKLGIVVPNEYQLAGKLSGGNQQKVVIGKWLHTEPEVFILDEPTRGIDVGAKSEIYSIIDSLAQEGVSVILISSEIEEILGMSDRVIVMANGSVSAILEADSITNANIIKYTMS